MAVLLGGGVGKLSEILGCSGAETQQALDRLIVRYEGFARLKQESIPLDAARGYFTGLDGRKVPIPGASLSERKHLCMSGYLQNGEAIIIKDTAIRVAPQLPPRSLIVNIVHDEFVIETTTSVDRCREIRRLFEDEIIKVGIDLNLRCPLKGDGSYGLNWYEIH